MNSTGLNILIWTGVLLGVLGGLAGAVIGTRSSIRNTKGPRERAFMVRCSIGMWMVLIAWLAALFIVPRSWHLALIISFAAALPFAVRYTNRRQRTIRIAEEQR